MSSQAKRTHAEEVSLNEAANHLLEECRMVLPGIQALFGFQLVAVFNNRFNDLESGEQIMHLVATGLVAIAVALIMTPAAYHRQTTPREVSWDFIQLSSRLLLMSMFPLAVGICLDFFLIAQLMVDGAIALPVALALFVLFIALWYVLPRLHRPRSGPDRDA